MKYNFLRRLQFPAGFFFFPPILSDKPVVGDEFLVQFLQNYEMEEDVRMLLEMPANGEKELAGRNDGSQATSPGLSL